MIKIVVIMSVYKNDKVKDLKEALESLYNQTRKADIYLQLDGKVPDKTLSYLDDQLTKGYIHYLGKRDENLGLAASLNELLDVALARGYEYIVRMDADDISVKTRIEKQVLFLEENSQISAVGGWIEEFNVDTNQKQIVRYAEHSEQLKKNLMKRNPLAHVTICFRNRFFDTISCYDTEKLNEDYDLWIKAFKNDLKLYCLQEVMVRVRTNNAFFERRRNIKRAVEVMLLKFDATKTFGFGIKGYLYAVAHFMLFLSPSWMKRYLYKNMRD